LNRKRKYARVGSVRSQSEKSPPKSQAQKEEETEAETENKTAIT
jgi:hypothetical protein